MADLIGSIVLFSVFDVIINFLHIFFSFIDFFIKVPLCGSEPLYVPDFIQKIIVNIRSSFCSATRPLLLIIIIFYIIFYIIYLIIITIIPETGFATFFIPLRELLLQIPPLPQLERYGVFRLLDGIINAFGLPTSFERWTGINIALFKFSRDNIKTILKIIFKDTEFTFLEDNNENKEDNKIKEESKIDENTKRVYNNIDEDVNICYRNNKKPVTFDMNEYDRLVNNYQNTQEYIKCKANSIGKYIRTNN